MSEEKDLCEQLITLRGYTRSPLTADGDPHIVYHAHEKIQFFVSGLNKLDMAYFYKAYDQMDPDVTHMIFIYTVATIQIKKLKMYKDVLRIEFFSVYELKRLLRGNRLIPLHQRMDADAETRICNKFGKENLPHILQTDPIVRLHDFKLDSVVEIHRPDVVYYRLVVADD